MRLLRKNSQLQKRTDVFAKEVQMKQSLCLEDLINLENLTTRLLRTSQWRQPWVVLLKKIEKNREKKRLSHCEKVTIEAIFRFYKNDSLKEKILFMYSIKTRNSN